MTKDEALKLALSALDEVRQETFRLMRNGETLYAEKKVWMAIYTIKKVLAQPKQEPVAWEQFYPDIGKPQIAINSETVGYVAPQLKIEGSRHVICQCDKCKAQPEQEPVAWGVFEGNLHDMFFTEAEAVEMAQLKGNHAEVKPLYTATQRPWVGLTDEELREFDVDPIEAKLMIAKLKEKNHD